MAFRPASAPAATNTATGAARGNADSRLGYLNIYVPTKSGERKKVGVIYLNGTDPIQAAVAKRLIEGGEEALKQLVEEKFQFVFNAATATNEEDLDI